MIKVLKEAVQACAMKMGYKILLKNATVFDNFGVDPIADIQQLIGDPKFHKFLLRPQIKLVLDVGANVGEFSMQCAKEFPDAQIHAFEPVAQTFNSLKKQTSGETRIRPHQFGFGSIAEERTIYIHSKSVLASCVDESPHVSSSRANSQSTISLRTIDEFCESNHIDEFDLLKVDTEGFDLEVLKGANRLLEAKKISFIMFEFFYVGDDSEKNQGGRLIEIHEFLRKYGYLPASFYTDLVHWSKEVGAFNALYMRR